MKARFETMIKVLVTGVLLICFDRKASKFLCFSKEIFTKEFLYEYNLIEIELEILMIVFLVNKLILFVFILLDIIFNLSKRLIFGHNEKE